MKDKEVVFQPITEKTIVHRPEWQLLTSLQQEVILVVSQVLPFRVNRYIVENLIDWSNIPDDPIFQLTFPQRDMLNCCDYEVIRNFLADDVPEQELQDYVAWVRYNLNPHPAGQMTHNIPYLNGRELKGVQHKYRETVLFFPEQGQTCHAYCAYCFRWPQFVSMTGLKFHSEGIKRLVRYLASHKEVTDVLFTGGDPMIMKTMFLRRYIEPLLVPELEHIRNIRIGTKAVVYHPNRFVGDSDADDCLRLFEQVVESGRHMAIMAHYSHPRELEPPIAQAALSRILGTGALVRAQSPVVRHVNDDSGIWAELWRTEVKLGVIPYYMFVERDTGVKNYYEMPLVRCWEIFRDAYKQVSGLARTVRGPSMSALPGKIRIVGVDTVLGQKVFVLEFIQGRNPEWVGQPFLAEFDSEATWLDQLKPAFGRKKFFFENE